MTQESQPKERRVHPIVRPMAGVAGRTSEWRTQRPELRLEACTKCMICVIYCPDDVIELDVEGFPKIDQYYCKGCMICMEVCPHDAFDEIQTYPGGDRDVITEEEK